MKTRLMAASVVGAVACLAATYADASPSEALADLMAPCAATGAVAYDNNYGNSGDRDKIMITYGFFMLTMNREPLDHNAMVKQQALYRSNPQQFAVHYQACLRGTADILAGARTGLASGLANLGY